MKWAVQGERYNSSERRRQYHAEYRETRRELARQQSRGWYENNKEYAKERQKKYRINNKEKVKTSESASYQKHIEKKRAKQREYHQKHPEVAIVHNQMRRARMKKSPINDFTPKQWLLMKAAYQYKCVYCEKKCKRLTMDHITPISKGGAHTLSNIVPSCRACNLKKKTAEAPKMVQPLLLI